MFAGQICFLDLYAKSDLLNRHETEVDECDVPPDDSPDHEKVWGPAPAEELHVTHLDIPDFRCGCAHYVAIESLCSQLCHSCRKQVQNDTVAIEVRCKSLFWYDGVELYWVKPKSKLNAAFMSTEQEIVPTKAEQQDSSEPRSWKLNLLKVVVQEGPDCFLVDEEGHISEDVNYEDEAADDHEATEEEVVGVATWLDTVTVLHHCVEVLELLLGYDAVGFE